MAAAVTRLSGPSWQILITTIPHRHATLCELLEDLDRQVNPAWLPQVSAVLYRDNLTVPYGAKIQAMVNWSTADYVSCIDDDDLLAPDGVRRIMNALAGRPDYVGFAVRWTRNGILQIPVEHSLRHPAWENGDDMLKRSVMQFNPVRRDIALDGSWQGGYGAERDWQAGVLAAGRCKSEAWLPPPAVYWYRESEADTFKTFRAPMPEDRIPALPSYPWLTVLDAEGSV